MGGCLQPVGRTGRGEHERAGADRRNPRAPVDGGANRAQDADRDLIFDTILASWCLARVPERSVVTVPVT
jgi:hypothetical protein